MKVAKVLFWLGIVIAVVGVCGNAYTLVRAIGFHAVGYNKGAFVVTFLSPIWQGGLLVGVSKIIELLDAKRH